MYKQIANDLIKNQKLANFIFILALILSLSLLNKKNEATSNSLNDLGIFYKVLIVFIYLYFLYISYTAFSYSKSKVDHIALISSFIAVIPPIIMLFLYLYANNDPDKLNPQL